MMKFRIYLGLFILCTTFLLGQSQELVIAKNSVWKYQDTGQNLGEGWRSPSFNDGGWSQGAGILGYGETDIQTEVSYGPDSSNKYITTYFRKSFDITDASSYNRIMTNVLRDDGVAVYLNGHLLFTSNMPSEFDYLTLASEGIGDADERIYYAYVNTADFLLEGSNVIAVEVHQYDPGSSDLGFDLEMYISDAAYGDIRINEVGPRNVAVYLNPDDNQFQDWLELYNPKPYGVDLTGYYLTDDLNDPVKWQFPDGTTIGAEGYLVISADGTNNGLHASFRLSGDGERLVLFDPEKNVLDSLTYPSVAPDESYGILDTGARGFFGIPTPGYINGEGFLTNDRAAGPTYSAAAGFYNGNVSLSLTTLEPGGEIRYTLDGSQPDLNSDVYSSPIQISSNKSVRAKVFASGMLPSETTVQSYFVDENHDLPVISITTDPDYLYDNDVGIYLDNNLPVRKLWERPGTIEFFVNESREFVKNIDYRLFGRGAIYFPKKSLAIYIRRTNGYDGLNYELFPTSPVTHYQSFVLRSSSDDWRNTMFRDGMQQNLLAGIIDLEHQNYRPAVLYLNGDYYGIYNFRDKHNEVSLATHKGVDPENLDLVYVDNDYSPPDVEIKAGDDQAYWSMYYFISENDMRVEENYKKAAELIDLNNYQDYCAVEIITANRSWLHNRRVWRPRTPSGKFRYLLFDLDYGYQYLEQNILNSLNSKDMIFKSLMKNKEFKAALIQKLALYSQTVFQKDRVDDFIDEYSARIESEIPDDADRWGSTDGAHFKNKGDWEDRVDVMRNFNDERVATQEGYIQDFLGDPGRINATVTSIPADKGTLYIHQVDVGQGFSGYLYDDQAVWLKAEPKAGSRFSGWSGNNLTSLLAEGYDWEIVNGRVMNKEIKINGNTDFAVQANYDDPAESNLIITELHYFPDNNQAGDDCEFIEIYNKGNAQINLSAYQISGGISYTFPNGSSIGAGEVVVVVKDPAQYPNLGVQVFDWDDGRLSDSGEEIVLKNDAGTVLDRVFYQIINPWPERESGYSIQLCDEDSDNNSGVSWKLSGIYGGSPGVFNSYSCPTVYINEVVGMNTGQDYLGTLDWIEIVNSGNSSFDLGGLYVTDEQNNPLKYQIPSGFTSLTTIKPGEYKILIADGFQDTGPLHTSFKISGGAGYIGLFYHAPDGSFVKIDEVQYGGLPAGSSFARIPDGRGDFKLTYPTPGRQNSNPTYEIVAPEKVVAGEEMPVLIRITDEQGQIDKSVVKTVQLTSSSGTLSPSEVSIRNGVGSANVMFTATSDFELGVAGYDYSRPVSVENIPDISVSGTISDTYIMTSGVSYQIDESITISSSGKLIVEPGAKLLMGRKANVYVYGGLDIQGTLEKPVVIKAQDPASYWGGFRFEDQTDTIRIAYAFFVRGGGDSGKAEGHSYSQPIFKAKNAILRIDNSYFFDIQGKGMYSQYSQVFISNSLYSRLDTGPEFEFSLAEVRHTWFIDIPDNDWSSIDDDNDPMYFEGVLEGDDRPNIVDGCVVYGSEDDGIDTSGTKLIVTNSWFSRNYEKGISAGWRSDIRVENCLFYRNYVGVNTSFWTPVVIDHTTFYKNTFAVHSNFGGGTVENSILVDHSTEYCDDAENVWQFNYCLSDSDSDMLGTGNVYDSPDFNDTEDWDFSLSAGSPAIDAGDPRFKKDADGSVTDVGFLPFGNGISGKNALVFSEIHYNPAVQSGVSEQYEFVELSYGGYSDLDVSGYRISDAIEFTFPSETVLKPGEIVVLAFEKQSYIDLDCRVFEWSSGKLSNSGETISLYDDEGQLVDMVTYGDADPWPEAADGNGFSLELTDIFSDNLDVEFWVASQIYGGTPGEAYQPIDFTKVKINEFCLADDSNPFGWLEIHNDNLNPLYLSGMRLRTSDGDYVKFTDDREWMVSGVSGFKKVSLDPLNFEDPVLLSFKTNDQLFFERFDGFNWLVIDELTVPSMVENQSYGRYPDGSESFHTFTRLTPGLPNSLGSSRIVTTRTFKEGDVLPIVVRLEEENDEPFFMLNYNISVSSSIDLSESQVELVNGQGGFVPTVQEKESFTLSFNEIDDTVGITHREKIHRVDLEKKINFDQTWSADHEYYITNELQIPAGVTLTIEPGTRIFIDKDNVISVLGRLVINGTISDPVVITSIEPDRPWGNIKFGQYSGGGQLNGVFFINGGGDDQDIVGYTDSQAVLEVNGAEVNLDNCFFIQNPGKALYAYGGAIVVNNSLVSETESGFLVQEGSLNISDTWIQFLPDKSATYNQEEHDAAFISGDLGSASFDQVSFGHIADDAVTAISGASLRITNSYFRYTGDKAITINQSAANLSHLLVVHCDEGISVRGEETCIADHLTMDDNGIHVKAYASTAGNPGDLRVQNSILVNPGGAYFYKDDLSNLSIRYTLTNTQGMDGTGNIQADPGFVNWNQGDYRLAYNSPALDSGDPESAPDNDGSRTDMGAFTGREVSDSEGVIINEIMYAPKAGTNSAEFIELYNSGQQELDLSGFSFNSGVDYTFANGIKILPGEFMVITSQQSVYHGQGYQVFQWTSGNLDDNGENISLVDSDGKVVNLVSYSRTNGWPTGANNTGYSIELKDPGMNNSLAANWHASYESGGTPGRENSSPSTEGIVINEIMARNLSVIQDETGSYVDWIELYNTSNKTVTLNGLYLSKDESNLAMFELIGPEEEMLLGPGEYQIVWLDAMPEKGAFHANFVIAGAGDYLALSRKVNNTPQLVNSLTYSNLGGDISFGRFPNGSGDFMVLNIPTPGGSNDIGANPIVGLKINELLARNSSVYLNDIGEYDDWIELYNHTGAPIDIAGLYFSDDPGDPLKSRIPFGHSAETTIEPYSFLMLFPSAKPESGARHLDFQLAGGGESVVITQILQTGQHVVDQVDYPALTTDISYGRTYDGYDQWQIFETPTPNSSNGYNAVGDVEIDNNFTIYPNPVSDRVTISISDNESFDYEIELLSVLSSETVLLDSGHQIPAFQTVQNTFDIRRLGFNQDAFVIVKIRMNERIIYKKLIILPD